MIEKSIEKYLTRKCEKNALVCLKLTSFAGVPDRIILGKDITLLLELKTDDGVIRPRQKVNIKRLRTFGVLAGVVDSKEQIDKIFELIKAKKLNERSLNEICIF